MTNEEHDETVQDQYRYEEQQREADQVAKEEAEEQNDEDNDQYVDDVTTMVGILNEVIKEELQDEIHDDDAFELASGLVDIVSGPYVVDVKRNQAVALLMRFGYHLGTAEVLFHNLLKKGRVEQAKDTLRANAALVGLDSTSVTSFIKKHKLQGLRICAWCKSWTQPGTDEVIEAMTPGELLVSQQEAAETSHAMCVGCKEKLKANDKIDKQVEEEVEAAKANESAGLWPEGTSVRVSGICFPAGDTRNVGRPAVIVGCLVNNDNQPLYEVHFTDGITHDEPHWMNTEAGLKDGNSAHYRAELERL